MPRTGFDGLMRNIGHVIKLLADDRTAGTYRDKQEISQVFLQGKGDQVAELQTITEITALILCKKTYNVLPQTSNLFSRLIILVVQANQNIFGDIQAIIAIQHRWVGF